MNSDQREWLINADQRGGSFVKAFATACLYADEQNFKILEPALKRIMEKYSGYSRRQA